jgi:hypothetical protein
MLSVEVRGTDKLTKIAAALRATPNKELRKELGTGLRRAARPMRAAFKHGALGILPYRGGLAEQVASDVRYTTKVNLGTTPSLRIVASLPGHDLAAMEKGRLRHPVYGHRRVWVTQNIRPGWFSDSGALAVTDVRRELLKAIDDVAKKLEDRL